MKSDQPTLGLSSIPKNIAWLVIQFALIGVILFSAWFVCSIISDGIDSKLIAMDYEPAEGWDYWRSKYRNEAIKGWAVPGIFAVAILGGLGLAVWKTLRRINTAINGLYKEED